VLDSITLQSTEIVTIAELDEERLEDRPVPVARRRAEFTLEMALEVVLDAIVVQQRVVHVDEEDDRCHGHDAAGTAAAARAEVTVRFRNDSRAGPPSISSLTRQRQFP
jgi:hypothetical protein